MDWQNLIKDQPALAQIPLALRRSGRGGRMSAMERQADPREAMSKKIVPSAFLLLAT